MVINIWSKRAFPISCFLAILVRYIIYLPQFIVDGLAIVYENDENAWTGLTDFTVWKISSTASTESARTLEVRSQRFTLSAGVSRIRAIDASHTHPAVLISLLFFAGVWSVLLDFFISLLYWEKWVSYCTVHTAYSWREKDEEEGQKGGQEGRSQKREEEEEEKGGRGKT